jgi:hypothetical protein
VGLKINETHQLLRYADDVNLLGDNIKKKVDAGKEVGLEVNTEKTKYVILSRNKNTGQNHNIKRANR